MKHVAARNGLIVLAASAVFYDSASAQSPPAAPAPASLSFSVVVGRWARTEGPYVININSVDVNGLMPATLIRSRFLFTPQKWFATGADSSFSLNCALAATAGQPTRSTMMLLATA
jgi:hypothetical protein